jgi:hypothetical protein
MGAQIYDQRGAAEVSDCRCGGSPSCLSYLLYIIVLVISLTVGDMSRTLNQINAKLDRVAPQAQQQK